MLSILNKYNLLKEYKQLHGVKNLMHTIIQSIWRKIKRTFYFDKSKKYKGINDKEHKELLGILSKRRRKIIKHTKIAPDTGNINFIIVIFCSSNHIFLNNTLQTINMQSFNKLKVFLFNTNTTLNCKCIPTSFELNQINSTDSFKQIIINENYSHLCIINEGDLLEDNALRLIEHHIAEKKDLSLIYSDHDIHHNCNDFHSPFFKPDFSPHYLNSYFYTDRMAFYTKTILNEIICTDELLCLPAEIPYFANLHVAYKNLKTYHISDILIHQNANDKYFQVNYFEILKRFYKIHNTNIQVQKGKTDDTFYVKIPPKDHSDLISIIIPFKDQADLLKECLESIIKKTSYWNYEIILVSNNSKEQKTFNYLNHITKTRKQIRIFYKDIPFNFSALNNYAVDQANGKYIVFLNNDTSIITPRWLEEMIGQINLHNTGAVGAKLLYADNTVQHAGVVTGFGGCADHVFVGFSRNDAGYYNRLNCVNNYSACTAACLMIRKSDFNNIGGFDEKNFKVAFNDVDLCLRILKSGKYVVYNPHVELYHYESTSRGKKETKDGLKRYRKEIYHLKKKWLTDKKNDPFYNQHLTINKKDFSIDVMRMY